jgi:hypothetical protein
LNEVLAFVYDAVTVTLVYNTTTVG